MNELILNLAVQAGYTIKPIYNGSDDYQTAHYKDPKLEKFAHLIVQECANLFPLQHTDEQYSRRIDKTILKHFGMYP
jgi:hypothetical protein